MPKTNETVLEINLTALGKNYQYLKSKLQPNTKFLAVVKAFAYGSDSVIIAKELENLGVDYLAVAYVNEGIVLRDAGIKSPIIVLHPQAINFDVLIARCLEPSIYSKKVFLKFMEVASSKKQANYPIHLKFNTGLNRLGFKESDVEFIILELNKNTSVKVASIFSHLAASEEVSERVFSESQIERFQNISEKLLAKLEYQPLKHMCNTSGILNFPEAYFDMVRSGIGLYGFSNIPSEQKNFTPIATLKSVISQIHSIKKGETVGYNRAFKSTQLLKSATIPIGHADGISRDYGNGKGWVTINGKKAPIIGNVCMDMLMVNVSEIECNEGDEVILFGKHSTAEDLSKNINSISYELITAISQRIKRVVYR